MISVKLGRRGQMTLPAEIRESLELSEGDRIAFVRQGGVIVVQPMQRSLLDQRGSVKVSGKQNFEEIRQNARKQRVKKRSS